MTCRMASAVEVMSGAALDGFPVGLSEGLSADVSTGAARGKSISTASSAVFDLDATGFDKALTGNYHSTTRAAGAARRLRSENNVSFQPMPTIHRL